MRRAALVALLLAALVAGGCGLGAGRARRAARRSLVTRDFGAREVGTARQDPIRAARR